MWYSLCVGTVGKKPLKKPQRKNLITAMSCDPIKDICLNMKINTYRQKRLELLILTATDLCLSKGRRENGINAGKV